MTDRYWICLECGNKYGKARFDISTWHVDKCDYCGKVKVVTEARDFGYPKKILTSFSDVDCDNVSFKKEGE